MMDPNGHPYCCWLWGSGRTEEEIFDFEGLRARMPSWIRGMGKFECSDANWTLEVGISHHDEEWRQENDVLEFLRDSFPFLHELVQQPESQLRLNLVFAASSGSCDFDGVTLGLMSALNLGLSVYWGYKIPTPGTPSSATPSTVEDSL